VVGAPSISHCCCRTRRHTSRFPRTRFHTTDHRIFVLESWR
jgi:hypothetical protein